MLTGINPMMLGNGFSVDQVFATDLNPGTTSGQTVPISIAADFTWNKLRNTSNSHIILDSLRPGTALTLPGSAQDNAYSSGASATPDGFKKTTVVNATGNNVNWSFKRAKKFFTLLVYNGNGSNGRILNHDLGITPGLIVIKSYRGTGGWAATYLNSSGSPFGLRLDATDTFTSSEINDITDTSFSVISGGNVNVTGRSYVAYIFANNPSSTGLIRTGLYSGNSSATGPIINLGWEPQWLLIKGINTTTNWAIVDNKRSVANPRNVALSSNTVTGETSSILSVDFLSTGFQLRSAAMNADRSSYFYMAIRKGRT